MQLESKNEYKIWIESLKNRFRSSQIKASIKVNTTLLEFYWDLGGQIVQKQEEHKWGSGFLEKLSRDLSAEFPDVKGFSYRNIRFIRQWYIFWQQDAAKIENENWQQLVAILFQVPWGHHQIILNKSKNIDEAIYYVQNTLKNGISRSVLVHQIESNLYERNGKALTNFENTLPSIQSDLAKEITKDPYIFDFVALTQDYQEKELEDALTENITNFLLELGSGFAFVGRQYKLIVGGDEFKIDLLFYHIKLKCYVVVELKATSFKPEHAGKLSFCTSAIDGELKAKDDNPTIGILICKSKNNTMVEYALRDINKPLGISEYQLTEILPKEYKSSLPSIEEIEAKLDEIKE
jgi:predicted nuclease of restriction endonuclease-like (RecB) superfamily